MALGKAFIEVHADTKPFARELATELNKILADADRDVKVSARKVGENISKETGNGIRANRKQVGKSISDALTGPETQSGLFRLLKGVIDTLDDGLSGLPAELKVGLAGVLIALLPFAIALGSAIVGGIVGAVTAFGVGGFGALLAAQFEEVKEAASDTFSFIRESLLQGGRFFIRPFLNALNLLRQRFTELQPTFIGIFQTASRIIYPLVDALLGLVTEFIGPFSNGLKNIDRFLAPIQIGFRLIGEAAGDFFASIIDNDDAPEALYDLLVFVEDLIQFFTGLVNVGLDFYGVLRDIAEFIGIVNAYDEDIEVLGKKFNIAGQDAGFMGESVEGTISPLEEQQKALEDVNTQLDAYIKLQFDIVGNKIGWEQAIDDLTESVKENGRSLKISEQSGRDNAQALLDLAKVAIDTREDNIALGDSAIEAQVKFEAQRKKIFDLGRELGLSRTRMDELVGAILSAPAPVDTGVTKATVDRLIAAAKWAQTLTTRIAALIKQGAASVVTAAGKKVPAYGDGTIATSPHLAMVGDSPEAIIPMNNPTRAATLLNQSGLSSLMTPEVNVYIGNSQIDAYVDNRVSRSLAVVARTASTGTRG